MPQRQLSVKYSTDDFHGNDLWLRDIEELKKWKSSISQCMNRFIQNERGILWKYCYLLNRSTDDTSLKVGILESRLRWIKEWSRP